MTVLIGAAAAALALLAPSSASPKPAPSEAALARELRERDQRLLVAVHAGGRVEWADATTPDFAYVEEGGLTPRDRFLAELKPDDGAVLRIRDHHVTRTGDVAVVVHTDEVPPHPGDARPPGFYLMTETWQRLGGRWKLHLVHVDAVRAPPPVAALPAFELDALAGAYTHGEARLALTRDGPALRTQGRDSRLEPETRDVFFDRTDLRRRVIFQRDAAGHVTGFVHRDENRDSVWTRAAEPAGAPAPGP